jgi:hypothetical protein
MKRIILIITIVLLTITVLGCGGSEPITVTLIYQGHIISVNLIEGTSTIDVKTPDKDLLLNVGINTGEVVLFQDGEKQQLLTRNVCGIPTFCAGVGGYCYIYKQSGNNVLYIFSRTMIEQYSEGD